MAFNFDFLKNIFTFFSGVTSKLVVFKEERKQRKQKDIQKWCSEVVCMKEELFRISPISIFFTDDIACSVKAYEQLQLLIDKYIAAKQGTSAGIKSASGFLNQCSTSLEYLHCIYKGKEIYNLERFREFYADVYCDFNRMLSWEISFYSSDKADDACPFEPHDHSSWFITMQNLTG